MELLLLVIKHDNQNQFTSQKYVQHTIYKGGAKEFYASKTTILLSDKQRKSHMCKKLVARICIITYWRCVLWQILHFYTDKYVPLK